MPTALVLDEPCIRQPTSKLPQSRGLRGAVMATGDHQNILKTKPPLCIDVEGADFYVDTLDRVLTEGW